MRLLSRAPVLIGARIPSLFFSTSAAGAGEVGDSTPYVELMNALAVPTHLSRTASVLHWDSMVNMPDSGGAQLQRSLQAEALAGVIHEKLSSIGPLVDLVDPSTLTPLEQVNFRLASKTFNEALLVGPVLEKRKAKLEGEAYAAWTEARKKSGNFSIFQPALSECFSLATEIARKKAPTTGAYTKMLDDFEVGMPEARINDLFDQVQQELVPLIKRVSKSLYQPSTLPLRGSFPLAAQDTLNGAICKAMTFTGRRDVSVHPFTTSFSSADVRITSRFSDSEWYQGLAGTIHEAGHALYESNLDPDPKPVNAALSMGAHESQSLFWERHVGLSRSFWDWCGPKVRHLLDVDATDEQIFEAVNAVSPSLIRVEADELTYPLHVIIRTEIERDVVNGVMSVEDIPRVWGEKYKQLLGVDVPSDDKGCLQDVHWSGLAIGYFPTYLIGAIAAAQLEHYIRKDVPNFDQLIASGEFVEIREWLSAKIHVHGSKYDSLDAMLEDQVGEELNPEYFFKYLKSKYEAIYQLNKENEL